MEELLKKWGEQSQLLAAATAGIDAEIATLQEERAEIAAPYQERISELEAEIRERTLLLGESVRGEGVYVTYRKGAHRVTYDWRTVDSVAGVLKDVMPDTAKTLMDARKETTGNPSVSIREV